MKLTYRGGTYEVPAPIQFGSDSQDQPKIKLIYRGHTYYITPCSVMVPEVVKANASMVTLIYRGNPYGCKLHPSPRTKSLMRLNNTQVLVGS